MLSLVSIGRWRSNFPCTHALLAIYRRQCSIKLTFCDVIDARKEARCVIRSFLFYFYPAPTSLRIFNFTCWHTIHSVRRFSEVFIRPLFCDSLGCFSQTHWVLKFFSFHPSFRLLASQTRVPQNCIAQLSTPGN